MRDVARDRGAAHAQTSGPAPTISGVRAYRIRPTAAWIYWHTDVPATSQVEWGTTARYGHLAVFKRGHVLKHYETLAGLQSSTTYHYRVRSRSVAGVLAIAADHIFTTSAAIVTPRPRRARRRPRRRQRAQPAPPPRLRRRQRARRARP